MLATIDSIWKKISNSWKNINHKLFIALLVMGLVPTIYTTFRVFWLGNLPGEWSYSIAGQLSWINLIYEVVNEAIILPLFYFIGKVLSNTKELNNRMKTGLLITLLAYAVLTLVIMVGATPLLNLMATDPSIIDASATYIRIEAIANIFGILYAFSLVGLVSIGKDKHVYILTGVKLILCLFFDTFLVSTLPYSANLGVNGIGISNIIVNFILLVTTLFLLFKNGINIFSKEKMDFKWLKEFTKIGSISGLESFVRNFAYMVMIARMVNVVNEQGTYWVANNFIWGWMLLPILQLGELIKQETSTNKDAVKNHTLGYFIITLITVLAWCVLIPFYKPFMQHILNFNDVEKLYSLVMILFGFYALYAIQNVFDCTFYGLGKTHYMLFESVVTNSIYYGTAYILWKNGVWTPSLENIAILFGVGNAFDAIVSFVAYAFLLKNHKINIFKPERELYFIDVKNEKITHLHYTAQGFNHGFYLTFESFMCRPGSKSWKNQGDVMSVLGTNGVFSIELYLKLLMVISTYDSRTFSGRHVRGHDLKQLYETLENINQAMINELEDTYSKSKYSNGETLKEFLKGVKRQFEEWRYSYHYKKLNINLNKLSDLLNILEDYASKKILPVANDLSINAPQPKGNNQTMNMPNDRDIKSNHFL